jgi:hypothetical protein
MNTLWARTLLAIYPRLPDICKGIDRECWNQGLGEYYNRNYSYRQDTIFNILIELNERKVRYINIRILVDDCLNSMPQKFSSILEDKYIFEKSTDEISFSHNISKRTVFRRLNDALEMFSRIIVVFGFTDEVLNKKFLCDYLVGAEYVRQKHIMEDENHCKQRRGGE